MQAYYTFLSVALVDNLVGAAYTHGWSSLKNCPIGTSADTIASILKFSFSLPRLLLLTNAFCLIWYFDKLTAVVSAYVMPGIILSLDVLVVYVT